MTRVEGAVESAARLRGFGTATLHEAAGRTGALDPRIKPIGPGIAVCAPVLTVRTAPGNNLAIHHGLYRTPPGWALAVATDRQPDFGYWGDIMTVAAQARGLAGLVIEGAVRDVTEVRATGFPIFAMDVNIRGTLKNGEGTITEPIVLGGVEVSVGDVLIGDDDGVMRVPLADVDDLLTAASEREAHEAEVRERLAAGETTIEIYGFAEGPEPSGPLL